MLLSLIELAANQALEFDPQTRAKLDKLAGKTIALEVNQQVLYFTHQPEGFELTTNYDGEADVHITTTLRALAEIGRKGMDNAELDSGELTMNGDAIIGQRFASALGDLNIDWEELLAQRLGDTPAQLAIEAGKNVSAVAATTAEVGKSLLHKWVHEELQITASHEQVDAFCDDVDTLKAKTARLAKRVEKLAQSIR